jgi:phenylacetate-CoA ligase
MLLSNLLASKIAIPLLMRLSKGESHILFEELIKFDSADREKLLMHQWDQFRSFMEYVEEQVPYYAESFDQSGIHAKDLKNRDDLLKIPIITKRQISANFPDRITSKQSNRDTWEYDATSGTTDRLMVIKDTKDSGRGEAVHHYQRLMRGNFLPGGLFVNIPPDACSAACAASVKRNLGFKGRVRQTIDSFTAHGFGGVPRSVGGRILRKIAFPSNEMHSFGKAGTRVSPETLQSYINELKSMKPAVLSGLPEFLLLLTRHIERAGETPPKVGYILPEASLSTPSLKNELRRVFQVPVHEVYGGHEFGTIASTCEQSDKLHIVMPVCLLETIRGGRNVPFGELGEIVVTIFTRKAMPLIRYCPGDVGRIYDDYCACGRQSLQLEIEGRFQDTIVTSKGIFTTQQIMDFFASFTNVDFFQIVQRDETRFDLLVVEKEDGKTNLNDLSDAVEEYLGSENKVRPRLVSTITPEESGKFRFVKSTSFQRFHEIPVSNVPSKKHQILKDQLVH